MTWISATDFFREYYASWDRRIPSPPSCVTKIFGREAKEKDDTSIVKKHGDYQGISFESFFGKFDASGVVDNESNGSGIFGA